MIGSGSRHLTFETVQRLGEDIVSRKYSGDRKFPTEAELGEIHDVSRTVTREAVKILTGKGLLTARPGRGTQVTPESQWNLLDPDILRWMLSREVSLDVLIEFTHTRLGFEPLAASLAARNATPEQKEAIARAIENMRQAEKGLGDPLKVDIHFHLTVLYASNNRFLVQLESLIETALTVATRQINQLKGVHLAFVDEHNRVAEAIFEGNAEAASAASTAMIESALELFESAR